MERYIEEDDFKRIGETNYQRIHTKLKKVGYADGISDGRTHSFQSGFDQGFADGLQTGLRMHKYKSLFTQLEEKDRMPNCLLFSEKIKYDEMKIPEIETLLSLSSKTQSNVATISAQQQHTIELLTKCRDGLPIATKLLNE